MSGTPASFSASTLGDAELLDALRKTEIERRRMYARELQLIAEIDARGIAMRRGIHIGVGALIRDVFNVNPSDARRMVAHAQALNGSTSPSGARLDPELPVVAETLADGAIAPEHVEAVRKAVTALPDAATVEDRVLAEKILCEAATASEPATVKRLGQSIADRLNPDGDAPSDEDLLRPRNRLDFHETKHGVSGSFDLDPATGELLRKLIFPLAKPAPTEDGGPDPRTQSERNGEAFADLIRDLAGSVDAPTEAGEPVNLMVTVALDDLRNGIGQGSLADCWNVSAAEIRRMACDAAVIPVVMGSRSEPLDIGRATRVVPRGIRRALNLRDGGCTFPSCTKKAKWTDAHHILEWSRGGPTTMDNLTLLCRRHHRIIHHSPWEVRMIHGQPWYLPPSYVDPARTPRRNTLHPMRT